MPPENEPGQSGTNQGQQSAPVSQEDLGAQNQGTQNDQKTPQDNQEALDVSKLDPRVQKMISDLRKENGEHRVRNKALMESHGNLKNALVQAGIIEDNEESPEQKLAMVSEQVHLSTVKNAILEAALEYGVGKEDYRYFEFLISDRLQTLNDEEELTEDDLRAIAREASRNHRPSGTTSIGSTLGKPNPEFSGEMTVEQFANLSIMDKQVLFKKNPDQYSRLFAEAKNKRLLFK